MQGKSYQLSNFTGLSFSPSNLKYFLTHTLKIATKDLTEHVMLVPLHK